MCTAVADLLPEPTAVDQDAPAPEPPVVLDMPGKVADFLRTAELDDVERVALDQGVTVRRGQGYTLRAGAVPPCTAVSSPAASRSTAAKASRWAGPAQGPPRVREPRQRPR
jgi:hypothetical protein